MAKQPAKPNIGAAATKTVKLAEYEKLVSAAKEVTDMRSKLDELDKHYQQRTAEYAEEMKKASDLIKTLSARCMSPDNAVGMIKDVLINNTPSEQNEILYRVMNTISQTRAAIIKEMREQLRRTEERLGDWVQAEQSLDNIRHGEGRELLTEFKPHRTNYTDRAACNIKN